ncbi:response regulator [Jannaschia sp. LMIT008]|uniref:response regulator n=1 Tax=Jannaschia maritima TaxID=3032585 RepID=UPI0028126408|nr:response regulator [Jannaschia sp. LMIT008]
MLDDLNILIVEDEALLAIDLSMTLEDEGATIAGPCMTLDAALEAQAGAKLDAAVLDVDLRGQAVFPLADRLKADGTPFVFHTGRANLAELRARYGIDVPILMKPSRPSDVVDGLTQAVHRPIA